MNNPTVMDADKEATTTGMELSWLERNTDARLEIIANYTLASFRVKLENWQKMLTTDHYRHIIMDWLNNPQRSTLVITLSSGGMLIAKSDVSDLYAPVHEPAPQASSAIAISISTSIESATAQIVLPTPNTAASGLALDIPLPAQTSSFSTLDGVPRGKYIYFTRRQPNTILTASNFQKEVIFGDVPLHSKIETVSLFFDEMFKPMLNSFFKYNNCPEIVSKDLKLNMKSVEKTLTEVQEKKQIK